MNARSQKNSFQYRPDGTVITEFFWDRSPVSVIQGPVGSGTSTACCHKMWKISLEQKPDANGKRRSRWLVVRNTYNDLKETTIKTWKYWFEEKALGTFGELKMTNPPNHHIKWDAPDGTVVDAEFIFLALDQEEDVRKLLSLECTGVWFNEAQFTEKAVFDTAHARAMQGRYPPKLDGGPTWKGVICDLNAPPEGHWIPFMRGDIPLPDEWDDDQRREFLKPDDWAFFVQPPGLLEVIEDKKVVGYEENSVENRMKRGLEDPHLSAENMKGLPESYLALIKGKPKNWIDTFVMNRVGIYRVGRPVFESFRPEIHVAKSQIEYQPEWPLLVGLDFARNPAAIIGQLIRGVLYILDEFGMENVSAGTFAPLLKQRIMRKFPGLLDDKSIDLNKVRPEDHAKLVADAERSNIRFFGDPSGGSKGQGTDWTPYIIFASHGMAVHAAPGNNVLSLRLAAIENQLNKMVDGRPGFLVDANCRVFKTGMGGGYHFAKLKGQARYHETPMKDRYSDYCDAGQYLALGAGLGHAALNPQGAGQKPKKREKKPYSMKRGRRRA
jgi:hypothetical protein